MGVRRISHVRPLERRSSGRPPWRGRALQDRLGASAAIERVALRMCPRELVPGVVHADSESTDAPSALRTHHVRELLVLSRRRVRRLRPAMIYSAALLASTASGSIHELATT